MIQRNINSSVNRSTNKSPFELLYGYQPRFVDAILSVTDINEEDRDLERIREEAKKNIRGNHRKNPRDTSIRNTVLEKYWMWVKWYL